MLLEELINILKQYDEDFPVYIDTGTGELPLESVNLDYINSETGVLVLKTYNSSETNKK